MNGCSVLQSGLASERVCELSPATLLLLLLLLLIIHLLPYWQNKVDILFQTNQLLSYPMHIYRAHQKQYNPKEFF